MAEHLLPISENFSDFAVVLPLIFLGVWILTARIYGTSLSRTFSLSLFAISYITIQAVLFMEDTNQSTLKIPTSQIAFYLAGAISIFVIIMTLRFNSRIAKPLKQVITQTNKMADGDYVGDFLVGLKGSGETASLLHSNRVLSNRFKTIVLSIKGSSVELANSAEELASGSEEVAATTEEVTGTIQTIAEGAAEQVRRLEEVSKVLNQMTNVIEESIRQIGLTSKITLDLAEQTNLVSLNAAIEAAKAGIQGEGFQVVAEHVRQLSIESKAASSQVTSITNDISSRMRDSVTTIIGAVDQIATVAENTAASSEEAAAAAEEQAASLQEITKQAQKLAVLSEGSERIITELRV